MTTKFMLGTLGVTVGAFGVAATQARAVRLAQAERSSLARAREANESEIRALEQRFAAAEQRARAADADAAQLLKAIQDAAPRIGLPPGDAACVAFVIDTSGSMRDPKNGGLWPVVLHAIRDALALYPSAGFVMGFDADGRTVFGGGAGWLPLGPDTWATIEQALQSYGRDSISNPVPGIYRAMRELPPPGKSGARLHVCVIGDEFIDKEEPVLRRLNELNAADAGGRRPATISAIQLPTTIRSPGGKMGNTGLRFQALMSEVARQHAGSYKLLPEEVLQP